MTQRQTGFTAVELLITLFVAAAFLLASYQLYSVIIRDGGNARAESRAANVALDYLRQYSTAAANPCVAYSPLIDSPITIDSLTNATITVAITCPNYSTTQISKVDVSVSYDVPQKIVTQSSLVNGTTGTPDGEVLDGLMAWWKFNGNAQSSVGMYHGTVFNATPSEGQNGQNNGGYDFNGSNAYISMPAGFADFTTTGLTISVWAAPDTSSSWARFVDFGNGAPNNNIIFARNGTSTQPYYSIHNGTAASVGYGAGTITNSAWRLYTMTQSTTGVVTIYINGVSQGSSSAIVLPNNVTRTLNYIGRSNFGTDSYYDGKMDDLRIYRRALTGTEISTLYTRGAQ